jgi:hypothetical protein
MSLTPSSASPLPSNQPQKSVSIFFNSRGLQVTGQIDIEQRRIHSEALGDDDLHFLTFDAVPCPQQKRKEKRRDDDE